MNFTGVFQPNFGKRLTQTKDSLPLLFHLEVESTHHSQKVCEPVPQLHCIWNGKQPYLR